MVLCENEKDLFKKKKKQYWGSAPDLEVLYNMSQLQYVHDG